MRKLCILNNYNTRESISSGALMIGKKMAKEFSDDKGFFNLEVTIQCLKKDVDESTKRNLNHYFDRYVSLSFHPLVRP